MQSGNASDRDNCDDASIYRKPIPCVWKKQTTEGKSVLGEAPSGQSFCLRSRSLQVNEFLTRRLRLKNRSTYQQALRHLSHLDKESGNNANQADRNHPIPCSCPPRRIQYPGKKHAADIHPYILAHNCYSHAYSDVLRLLCHLWDSREKNSSERATDNPEYLSAIERPPN